MDVIQICKILVSGFSHIEADLETSLTYISPQSMLLIRLCLAIHELRAPYGASTAYLCYYERSVAVNVALVKSIDFSGCHSDADTATSIFLSVSNVRNINVKASLNLGSSKVFFGLIGQYSQQIGIEDSIIKFDIASQSTVSKATILAPVANHVRLFATLFEITAQNGIIEDFFGLFSNTQTSASSVVIDACTFSHALNYYNSAYGVARVSGYNFLFNNSNVSASFVQSDSCT